MLPNIAVIEVIVILLNLPFFENLFIIFILFYLPHNNYKKYRKGRKQEVVRRPNRNYRK